MADLHNDNDIDLLFVPLHVLVPAGGSIEIPDELVESVPGTGVWRVQAKAATKRTVTRGGKQSEIDAPPLMETRG
jgi:hypothetical protein